MPCAVRGGCVLARPLPAGERSALHGRPFNESSATTNPASDAFHPHADFLQLRPIIDRHARVVFRTSTEVDREEASAEAVAAAFESYLRLKKRGKDPVQSFPSLMATFAARHVKDGRHVGGRRTSSDALSFTAQQKHGFRVASLKRCSVKQAFPPTHARSVRRASDG